jgi:uncharacterized membrane protein
MKTPATSGKRALSALVGGAALAVATGAVAFAATSTGGTGTTQKADFTLAAQPGSSTVQQGKSGIYTITAAATGGFAGTVALAVSGAPTGVTSSMSPASVVLGSASQASSTLTVVVAKTAMPGTYTLTVTGTAGSGKSALVHSAQLGLTVQKQTGSLSLTVSPSPLTIDPGSSGTYNISVARSGATVGASVVLTLQGALPAGATAQFASYAPTTVTTTSLQISASASTPTGSYPLAVTASTADYSATTAVSLVIAVTTGKAFTIADPSVAVPPLSPGVTQPLNLRISNPNSQPLSVTNITVAVQQPLNSACAAANFAVIQIPSGYPLTVPAYATASLLDLVGFTAAQLPRLQMKDLSTNQDACKGATVSLSYTGAGNSN